MSSRPGRKQLTLSNVPKRMAQGKSPALLSIAEAASTHRGHSEQPPTLFWFESKPIANCNRNSLHIHVFDCPSQHTELLTQQPVHRIVADLPGARLQGMSTQPSIESALDFRTNLIPSRPLEQNSIYD